MKQSYMTLVSKKKTPQLRQQGTVRIGQTDKSIILDKKFMALTSAVYHENFQKKVCFFTQIRRSYKILVSKKNHSTYGSKVPWELADLSSQ